MEFRKYGDAVYVFIDGHEINNTWTFVQENRNDFIVSHLFVHPKNNTFLILFLAPALKIENGAKKGGKKGFCPTKGAKIGFFTITSKTGHFLI